MYVVGYVLLKNGYGRLWLSVLCSDNQLTGCYIAISSEHDSGVSKQIKVIIQSPFFLFCVNTSMGGASSTPFIGAMSEGCLLHSQWKCLKQSIQHVSALKKFGKLLWLVFLIYLKSVLAHQAHTR